MQVILLQRNWNLEHVHLYLFSQPLYFRPFTKDFIPLSFLLEYKLPDLAYSTTIITILHHQIIKMETAKLGKFTLLKLQCCSIHILVSAIFCFWFYHKQVIMPPPTEKAYIVNAFPFKCLLHENVWPVTICPLNFVYLKISAHCIHDLKIS